MTYNQKIVKKRKMMRNKCSHSRSKVNFTDLLPQADIAHQPLEKKIHSASKS